MAIKMDTPEELIALFGEERKAKVDGMDINYVKVGQGEHAVLLSYGVLGTWADFKMQLEFLDRERFTLVAWDVPGYGRSIPPERTYPLDYTDRDARWGYQLMKALGYQRYSLIGWNQGCTLSLSMAIQFPENVRRLVLINGIMYLEKRHIERNERLKDIATWPEGRRVRGIALYGENYLQKTWLDMVNACRLMYEKREGQFFTRDLSDVKCPTLIVYGAENPLNDLHQQQVMKDRIANARLYVMEKAGLSLHRHNHDELNPLITSFFSED